MSNFQIQLNSEGAGSFNDRPWAAQVADLVEKNTIARQTLADRIQYRIRKNRSSKD